MDLQVVNVELSDEITGFGAGQFRAFPEFGDLVLQGWLVTESSKELMIELRKSDGDAIARVPVSTMRPDIADAFPAIAGAERSGFRLHLRPAVGGSAHILVVALLESDDLEFVLGEFDAVVSSGPALLPGLGNGAGEVDWELTAADGESAKVLYGKDGWLFLRRDSNDVLGQLTGKIDLDSSDRESWRSLLAQRMRKSNELGTRWECLIAPDKEIVYPERLPPEIVPSDRRPIQDILEVASDLDAPLTYLLDDLLLAKAGGDVYFVNDTHWNHRGAYVAYQALVDQIGEDMEIDRVSEDRITWYSATAVGDLGEKCYPEPVAAAGIRARIDKPRAEVLFDNSVKNHGRVIIFERRDLPSASTCVVFGESFADNVLPFLRESFRRLVFVHTSMYVEEIIRIEAPDVVVTLPVERFLLKIPSDRDAFRRLQATADKKGGQLPWHIPG